MLDLLLGLGRLRSSSSVSNTLDFGHGASGDWSKLQKVGNLRQAMSARSSRMVGSTLATVGSVAIFAVPTEFASVTAKTATITEATINLAGIKYLPWL